MPILTKDHLAMRLQQNWMAAAQHPRIDQIKSNSNTKETLDDSLTSLNWLQNLNMSYIGGAATPPVSPPMAVDPMLRESMKVDPNQVLATNSCPPQAYNDYRYSGMDIGINPHNVPFERIDYRTNPYVKPPYSYATLICMAMKDCRKAKITLSAIYNWITDNFMYYRMADPSWQNSIRHNLSLNKCFEKVARRKDEPGKGGFWRMNPNHNGSVDSGLPKKRKGSKKDNEATTKKRSKKSKSASSSDEEVVVVDTEPVNERNSLFSALSPPASDENSNDFDELLSADFSDTSTQYSTSDPLNLAVQGIKIEAPEWWSDSLSGVDIKGILDSSMNSALQTNNQINIEGDHPWSVDKTDIEEAIAALEDVDHILYGHALAIPAP